MLRMSAVIAALLPGALTSIIFALPAAVQSAEWADNSITVGNLRFTPPAGWVQTRGSSSISFQPPSDSPDHDTLTLAVFEPIATRGKSLPEFLDTLAVSAHKNLTEVKKTEGSSGTAPGGLSYFNRVYAVKSVSGAVTVRAYFGASVAGTDQAQLVLFAATDAQAFQKQSDTLAAFLQSFSGVSHSAGEASKTEPAAVISSTPSQHLKGDVITRGLWVDVGPKTRSRDGHKIDAVFVKDIAVDLTDHTIYVAAIAVGDFEPSGGLFASRDEGKSWQTIYGQDCTQIVPTGSSRLYALDSGAHILRSDDRGKSWTRLPTPRYKWSGGVDTASLTCLAASPGNPNILYAGAEGAMGAGVYRSEDGGKTWVLPTVYATASYSGGLVNVKGSACSEIVVDPQDPQIVYANLDGSLCQSSDGGAHFYGCIGSHGKGVGPGTRSPITPVVVKPGRVQFAPSQPNRGYLLCTENHQDHLYRTQDGGHTWNRVLVPGALSLNTLITTPGNPDAVYVATGTDIKVTADGGRTWKPLSSGNAPRSTGSFEIPSVFTGTAFSGAATVVRADEPVIIDPLTGHLLYGTAGGVRILVPVH